MKGKNKRKLKIILGAVIVIAAISILWYNAPLGATDLDPKDVKEIVIFDGNTGKSLHIEKQKDIDNIVESLNGLRIKRSGISLGYTGFRYKTTIYLNSGEEADGFNNFIINSPDRIRKDPFFYTALNSKTPCEYIEDLFEKEKQKGDDKL